MSSAQPKISLIMPVYNSKRYLEETLENALAQNIDDIEIICIDDGSSDSSADILAHYERMDERVLPISQSNKGAGPARNAGIAIARGEFIAFLDADDKYGDNSFLSRLYDGAVENDQLAAGGCLQYYHGGTKTVDASDEDAFSGYRFDENSVIQYGDFQFDYGFHRFIFSSKLFKEGLNRFPDLSYFEDPVFLTRILYQAKSFYAVADTAYWYRIDHKPTKWNTRKVIDLIEGAATNLEFSSRQKLGKLHWFTIQHFNEAAHYIGAGYDTSLDTDRIEGKLIELESKIDFDLLAQLNPPHTAVNLKMRTDIEKVRRESAFERQLNRALLRSKRSLAPVYHRIKG